MVSMETDVEELLALVVNTGSQIDEQVVQLSQMSELVRKGIVQASEDLQRENDEAVWQEGVLRHVPIVGSLYNWISPLQKPIIKGRCLSLKEGKLETTENIYKLQQQGLRSDLAPLKEHSYDAREKQMTIEESKNEINNRLHQSQVNPSSNEMQPDILESNEDKQAAENENSNESGNNLMSPPPTETESTV